MDCALWLNRRKIYTAAEIAGNPDVASLRGYLLAGTLIEWLNEHGGKRYAKKLSALSPDDDRLNEKIAEIFGIRSAPFKELSGENAQVRAESSGSFPVSSLNALLSSYPIGSAGSYNYAALSSFGSFQSLLRLSENSGSYSLSSFGSFSFGSFSQWEWEWLYRLLFGYGSFSVSSFTFGSFHQWEWEWLYRLLFGYGSFSESSFTFGSFSQWEWLFQLLFGYGSFSGSSFTFGSFSQWEWLFRLLFGYGSFSANSFSFGSFSLEELLERLFSGYGSFGSGAAHPDKAFAIDEYDLIMLQTLANCPLDRFGYGIHNI